MSDQASVCPFCPLHCDDVVIDAAGRINVDCPIAESGFKAAIDPPVYRIGDRSVSMDDAIFNAKQIFTSTAKPKVTCSGATLGLSRRLASMSQVGAIDLSLESTSTMAALRTAASREGFVGATLAEVKQHADLIWIIGNAFDQTPRLPRHFSADAVVRHFSTFSADDMATLGATPIEQTFGDPGYVAIFFAADAFDARQSILVAEWWTKWIVQANKTRRVVQVMLDPTQTIRSVTGWTSNEMLTTNQTTSDIRFGNPVGQIASIQVGGIDPGRDFAEAYVPTSVPGVHDADVVIRGDGAVTLGLSNVTDSPRERIEATSVIDRCIA